MFLLLICFISLGRLHAFHTSGPEYDILRLDISFLGFGGMELLWETDLKNHLPDFSFEKFH